jgi:hypothetical protein
MNLCFRSALRIILTTAVMIVAVPLIWTNGPIGASIAAQTSCSCQWTSVTYNSGSYTAGGSMTWTVESGDGSVKYILNNKTMTVAFNLGNTSVSGTLSNELRIAVPNGLVAVGYMMNTIVVRDNGVDTVGIVQSNSGQSYLSVWKVGYNAWSASTNDTRVQGQLVFEVQ